jgi:hypothetical protein
VLALLSSALLALVGLLVGGVTFAPAAQACPPPQYECLEETVTLPGGQGEYCSADGQTVTLEWDGATATRTYGPVEVSASTERTADKVTCDYETQADALAAATTAAEEQVAENKAEATAGATPGACVVTQSWVGEATTSGAAEYCTVEGTTVTLDYTGFGRSSSTTSQGDADYQAALIADREAQADLLSKTPTGAMPGACVPTEPETIAPVEPEVVAPVEAVTVTEEPAVVAVPEPATVQVSAPAKATVPSAVPAGDGSSVPQTPTWVLALLALGTVGLLTSTTRLATVRHG